MEVVHIAIGITSILVIATAVFFRWLLQPDEAAVDFDIPAPDPCKASWSKDAIVLEKPSISVSGTTAIQCYCPANGRLLGRVNPVTADGIDRAIARAKEAQVEWAKTSFSQRRKVLNTLLKYILKHQDDIVKVACLDSGKPRVDAAFGEVLVTAAKLEWTLKHGERALSPDKRPANLLMCYKDNEVRYEPLGVVAACVSWNYPFHNILNPIISSIFAGNAIIVKGSEQTAWSAHYYTTLVRAALAVCKQPYEIVQSVACWPSVAPTLTAHADISHITFIGSKPVAHAVAASAAKALTPVCVELGGKDAAIVLDDVKDYKKVASILMRGVFQSAGQNCVGIERVVATPKAYARILELVEERIEALRVGSALDDEEDVDVGACISAANFDRLEELISAAVMDGAELICGGARYTHPKYPSGHYFAPTLLINVTSDMAIAQQELFAPIFVLMRAASVPDAINITNATPYGLGCSVFGSTTADLERVTSGVRVGMVSVNDFASYYVCGLPFGGVNASGYGRFGGPEGLRAVCNMKSVCKDRFGSLLSTSIPPRLDYPVSAKSREKDAKDKSKAKAWTFVKGVVELGFAPSWSEKIQGLAKIIRNS